VAFLADETGEGYRSRYENTEVVEHARGSIEPAPRTAGDDSPLGDFGAAVDIVRSMQLSDHLPPLLVVGVGYRVATFAETLPMRTATSRRRAARATRAT
jgi:hypothetical protein